MITYTNMNRDLKEFASFFENEIIKIYHNGSANSLQDISITRLCIDTQGVIENSLFIARSGQKTHGAKYAAQAVSLGAVAIVTDTSGELLLDKKILDSTPVFIISNLSFFLSEISTWYYKNPSQNLEVVGITGTNGKTTATYFINQILSAASRKTCTIGTLGVSINNKNFVTGHTTPESTILQSILHNSKLEKVRNVVMEVSSHALALHRVRGIKFTYAGFSNLTQDHLDFHKNLEEYFMSKAKLFTNEYSENSFINIDSSYGQRLVDMCENEVHTLSRTNRKATWHFQNVISKQNGFECTIRGNGGILIESFFPHLGEFNLDNLLMAVAISVTAGVDPLLVQQLIPYLDKVPGRLEKIDVGQSFSAVVDFAHTPDAVTNILHSVATNISGKLIAVLGCGGDRDSAKRPLMGKALITGADIAIFTSDNPRSENAATIIAQMQGGFSMPETAQTHLSRKDAIIAAVNLAESGDAVVILGKGHEVGQEINGEKHPFDDRVILKEAILKKSGLNLKPSELNLKPMDLKIEKPGSTSINSNMEKP